MEPGNESFSRISDMVDGYSRSLRDATGPGDVYSRIPTSAQWRVLYALCICVHVNMYTCTMHKYCIIVLTWCTCTVCTRSCKISDYQHLGDPLSWPLGKNTVCKGLIAWLSDPGGLVWLCAFNHWTNYHLNRLTIESSFNWALQGLNVEIDLLIKIQQSHIGIV